MSKITIPTEERNAADNTDLDYQIADVLDITMDQVDDLGLKTVELLRELLWRLP